VLFYVFVFILVPDNSVTKSQKLICQEIKIFRKQNFSFNISRKIQYLTFQLKTIETFAQHIAGYRETHFSTILQSMYQHKGINGHIKFCHSVICYKYEISS